MTSQPLPTTIDETVSHLVSLVETLENQLEQLGGEDELTTDLDALGAAVWGLVTAHQELVERDPQTDAATLDRAVRLTNAADACFASDEEG